MSDGKQSGIGRIVKDKGSKRMLMFGGAVVALATGWAVLGGGGGPVETSQVASLGSRPDPTQAARPLTPQYGTALTQADAERAARAEQQGSSSIPTPRVQPVSDRLETQKPADQEPAWRPQPAAVQAPPPPVLPTPMVAPTPAPQQQAPVAPQQPQRPQVDQNLLNAMQRQMAGLMPQAIAPAQTQYLYAPNQQGVAVAGGSSSLGGASALVGRQGVQAPPGTLPAAQTTVSQAAMAQQQRSRFTVPAAGTVIYSRLIGKVDSDVQGPVLAEVLQGPFAGSRLLGAFTFGERGVAIRFTSMTVPFTEDGEERVEVVPINAVAVDSKHLGSAMATDIDRHLFERVGIAFATSFLQGMGQAIARSGSTVSNGILGSTTSYGSLNTREQLMVGAGDAAGATGRVVEQAYGNRRTTITVDADTPFGLLFLGSNNGN